MPIKSSDATDKSLGLDRDIRGEFGDPRPVSISEYYRGGTLVTNSALNQLIPEAGEISFSDFYGASKDQVAEGNPVIYLYGGAEPFNSSDVTEITSGEVTTGDDLLAYVGGITDDDQIDNDTWELLWVINGVPADLTDTNLVWSSATRSGNVLASFYSVSNSNEGDDLQVAVRFKDSFGTSYTRLSDPVTWGDAPTTGGQFGVSPATFYVGQTLSISNTFFDPQQVDSALVTWQRWDETQELWLSIRQTVIINPEVERALFAINVSDSYVATADDYLKRIRVTVEVFDTLAQSTVFISNETVGYNASTTGGVTLSVSGGGTATQGSTLTWSNNFDTVPGEQPLAITYTLFRDDVVVDGYNGVGTTTTTYVVQESDIGSVFTVTGQATDAFSEFTFDTSNPISIGSSTAFAPVAGSNVTVTEGNDFVVTLNITDPLTVGETITWTADSDVQVVKDQITASGTASYAAGETQVQITIPTSFDAFRTSASNTIGSFIVTIIGNDSNGVGSFSGSLANASAGMTIDSLSVGGSSVTAADEGDEVTIAITGTNVTGSEIIYATSTGGIFTQAEATAGQAGASLGTITWGDYDTNTSTYPGTLTFTVREDASLDDGSIALRARRSASSTVNVSSATLTVNNVTLPDLSYRTDLTNDVSTIVEGNNLSVTFRIFNGDVNGVTEPTIYWAITNTDGTAFSDSRISESGSFTAAAENVNDVSINVIDIATTKSTAPQGDKTGTIKFYFDSQLNNEIPNTGENFTLVDDLPVYTPSTSANVTEGESFVITLGGSNFAGENVSYSITNSAGEVPSRIASGDATGTFSNVTDGTQTVTIPTNISAAVEAAETLTITVTGNTSQVTGSTTITLNDLSASYTVTLSETSITEGGSFTIDIGGTFTGENVTWAITGDDSGRASSSGATLSNVTSAPATITVDTSIDPALQGSETWTVTVTGVTTGDSATATITVEDVVPTYSLSASPSSITTGDVTLTLSSSTGYVGETVNWEVGTKTGTFGTVSSQATSTLTINTGDSGGTVTATGQSTGETATTTISVTGNTAATGNVVISGTDATQGVYTISTSNAFGGEDIVPNVDSIADANNGIQSGSWEVRWTVNGTAGNYVAVSDPLTTSGVKVLADAVYTDIPAGATIKVDVRFKDGDGFTETKSAELVVNSAPTGSGFISLSDGTAAVPGTNLTAGDSIYADIGNISDAQGIQANSWAVTWNIWRVTAETRFPGEFDQVTYTGLNPDANGVLQGSAIVYGFPAAINGGTFATISFTDGANVTHSINTPVIGESGISPTVVSSNLSLNEDESKVAVTIDYTLMGVGSVVAYKVLTEAELTAAGFSTSTYKGVNTDDFVGNTSGSYTLTADDIGTNGDGAYTFAAVDAFGASADTTTEGSEKFVLRITGTGATTQYYDVTISDTSQTPLVKSITASDLSVDETGTEQSWTVSTANIANGTTIIMTVGIGPGDELVEEDFDEVSGGTLVIYAATVSNGQATFTFTPKADATTEGTQSSLVTFSGDGVSTTATLTINDTSTSGVTWTASTLELTGGPTVPYAPASLFTEGETVVLVVNATTNIAATYDYFYTVSLGDGTDRVSPTSGSGSVTTVLSGGQYVGSDVVNIGTTNSTAYNLNTTGTITIWGSYNATTETYSDELASVDFTLRDTTPVGITSVTADPTSIAEGASTTITVDTAGYPEGDKTFNWSTNVTTDLDAYSGTVTVTTGANGIGTGTFTVGAATDTTVESLETFSITVTDPNDANITLTSSNITITDATSQIWGVGTYANIVGVEVQTSFVEGEDIKVIVAISQGQNNTDYPYFYTIDRNNGSPFNRIAEADRTGGGTITNVGTLGIGNDSFTVGTIIDTNVNGDTTGRIRIWESYNSTTQTYSNELASTTFTLVDANSASSGTLSISDANGNAVTTVAINDVIYPNVSGITDPNGITNGTWTATWTLWQITVEAPEGESYTVSYNNLTADANGVLTGASATVNLGTFLNGASVSVTFVDEGGATEGPFTASTSLPSAAPNINFTQSSIEGINILDPQSPFGERSAFTNVSFNVDGSITAVGTVGDPLPPTPVNVGRWLDEGVSVPAGATYTLSLSGIVYNVQPRNEYGQTLFATGSNGTLQLKTIAQQTGSTGGSRTISDTTGVVISGNVNDLATNSNDVANPAPQINYGLPDITITDEFGNSSTGSFSLNHKLTGGYTPG